MKTILTTCVLFLVLPRKVSGETTLRPSSTRQHEDSFKDHETTTRGGESTIFSTKHIQVSSKSNGETTHNPSNNRQHQSPSKDHEPALRIDKPSILTTIHMQSPSEPNGETTHNPSNNRQHQSPSKEHEPALRIDKPSILTTIHMQSPSEPNGETTHSPSNNSKSPSEDRETSITGDVLTSSLLNKLDEYTTEESKNVSSSKSSPQTSEHQHVTNMTVSTGEHGSSSHLTSLPFTEKTTDQITITPLPEKIPEDVSITRQDQKTLHDFKSTNKGPDRYTPRNRTTRSVEKSFQPQTDNSTHFQKSPEVITNQSREDVKTTVALTTKWSSLPQEKGITNPPILNVTGSNETLDTGSEESTDTATYPSNMSTATAFSTILGPTVKTELGTSGTVDTMETTATFKITTKAKIRGRTHPNPDSEPTPTTQTRHTTTTTPKSSIKPMIPNSSPERNKDEDKKSHPGHIIASLIGTILFLMLVAFAVVWVRSHQKKKKQMENPDWAGPSPFIEGDVHPNLPAINEDGSFKHRESRRISLHSFLPQRLSKRLSALSPTDEEIPLEDTQASSTFGQCHVQALNGNATPDQIQTHEANSPPAEVSSESDVPETTIAPPAPENNENIQTAPKPDDEIIPSPPAEINNATPTPFEDVDLNLPVENTTESTPPSDAIPSPPPLTPS